ncbi:MAG TPA: alpha/beta hydrolase [Pilimelia sp.]|nr:alpha/beta hydrolase [Pilimelia sp.]
MAVPEFLNPLVLPTEIRPAERVGQVDLYLPDAAPPRPAVVFVHGGPFPAAVQPTPRGWPVYQAYGSAVAARGAVGVTVDHRLHDPADYPRAADDVAAAVEVVRKDARVDAGRVALWFFSGSALLMSDWLRDPPGWLRCVAANYPMLAPTPGMTVDPRFRPTEAVAAADPPPLVVTRVGRESPSIAATVDAFLTAAAGPGRAPVDVIDVPTGRHGFDVLDPGDESRAAVNRALDAVLATLR